MFYKFMGTWKRFRSLTRSDRRVVLEAAAVIVATHAGLRIAGYRRWASFLAALFPFGRTSEQNGIFGDAALADAERIARISSGAARGLFFSPTCLERSVGLWCVLRRRGIDAEIRIGGRKSAECFEAHAWVECAGKVLNDPSDEYLGFAAFGDANAVAARLLR